MVAGLGDRAKTPLRPGDGNGGPRDELEEDAESLPDLVAVEAELA
jgi:hypothetical protein